MSLTPFLKKIKLAFAIDDSELDKATRVLESHGIRVGVNADGVEQTAQQLGQKGQEKKPNKVVSTLEKGFTKLGTDVRSIFTQIVDLPSYDDVLENIASTIRGAWDAMNDLLGYSQLTNDNTLQLMEKGLTGAEAYAYDQANKLIGIRDFIEDGWRMSDQQRDAWLEEFAEEQAKYTRLYDSGYFEELQQFQWEAKEFRQDVQYEFMKIFMDNKDTIVQFFHYAIEFMEWTVKAVGKLLGNLFRTESSDFERSSKVSDVIQQYTGETKNTAVTVDNTFNFQGSMTDNKPALEKVGQLTYEQVIRALGGTLN